MHNACHATARTVSGRDAAMLPRIAVPGSGVGDDRRRHGRVPTVLAPEDDRRPAAMTSGAPIHIESAALAEEVVAVDATASSRFV